MDLYITAKYLPAGDTGIVVEFGNAIDPDINRKVSAMTALIEKHSIEGVVSVLPTYRSLLVQYAPAKISYNTLVDHMKSFETQLSEIPPLPAMVFNIPTLYGGEAGPDLGFVAEYAAMKEEDVVNIHSSKDYLIYMLGFSPGFPYLGGMDERIAAPRLNTPRVKIPGGSVGIAGNQTGVYSLDSPGGWQLIGRTPIKLFDGSREKPVLYSQGDYIRFLPVDLYEYNKIKEEVDRGVYEYALAPKSNNRSAE